MPEEVLELGTSEPPPPSDAMHRNGRSTLAREPPERVSGRAEQLDLLVDERDGPQVVNVRSTASGLLIREQRRVLFKVMLLP